MALSKGKNFMLQVGDGVTPTEGFSTIAGLTDTDITFNNGTIDVTTKDSNGWREIIGEIKSVTITASGINQDDANFKTARTKGYAGEKWNYRVFDVDTGDYFTGSYLATSIGESGGHTTAKGYSITLESSGQVTFTEI